MLKRVQHDKIEEFSRTKKNQRNACQPELVSGSNEMVKRDAKDRYLNEFSMTRNGKFSMT
jgi:hypothetical protein